MSLDSSDYFGLLGGVVRHVDDKGLPLIMDDPTASVYDVLAVMNQGVRTPSSSEIAATITADEPDAAHASNVDPVIVDRQTGQVIDQDKSGIIKYIVGAAAVLGVVILLKK